MKRSKFSLNSYRLQSMDLGVMDPIDVQEVLPGDSIRHGVSALIRVSPLVAPVMHPVEVQLYSFFVPNRIVWENWEDFIVSPDSGLTVPQVEVITGGVASNAYYLGRALGIGAAEGTAGAFPTSRSVNALPFRCHNMIWNEFFRDQDIDTPLTVPVGNGPDSAAYYSTAYTRWKKDYFTTARAAPQDGAAGRVDIVFDNAGVNTATVPAAGLTLRREDGTTFAPTGALGIQTGVPGAGAGQTPDFGAHFDIAAWRLAMAEQKVREHRNRFGSRYTDYMRFLGVTPSDARLQRPEYLGGGRQIVSFSEVLSTAATDDAVVGDMAGHGIAAVRTRPWTRFFEEHGHVVTLLCCRPAGVYAGATNRNWFRTEWEDYWQKETEMLGDQAVLKKELNNAEASATANSVFGYVPRHEEYRRGLSSIVGDFASTLKDWHYGRLWETNTGPGLNSAFLKCEPTERVYAESLSNQLRAMIVHQKSARRLVSKFARNP